MPPKAAKDAPPLRMIARSKEGIQYFAANQPGKFTQEAVVPNVDENVAVVYSTYGSMLAYREQDGPVCVVNSDTAEIMHKIPEQKVMELALSPKGTYLVTWRHVDRREPDVPTLRVYATRTGQEIAAFVQSKWPALYWTPNEATVTRVMGKGLYTIAGDFSGEIQSQIEERFTVLSASPANETLVALLLPYKQDDVKKNAVVKVVKGNQLDVEVLSQTLGKVDDADLMWNSTGAFLLVHAKTNVDETGRSYYGESLLVLFQIKGKQQWHIQLGQNEPLHDVQWAPNGQEFVAVYGEMPSNKVTLFSCAGNPLHHFPIAARNRCLWAPNGRYLLLAGFGNLAGDMEVWDRAKLGAATATSPTKPTTVGCIAKMTHKSVTSVSWSPDSRYLYTAVTFPRMRLDNRIAIWKHNGVLEDRFEYPELYQVMFRPMNAKVYGSRDPSPPPAGHTPQTIGKAASQVFRPSHGGNSAVAEAMRSHKAQQAATGFASRATSSAAFKEGVGGFRAEEGKKQDYIPGLPPDLQKAQAEAKRKAAEKAKEQNKDKPSSDPLHWRDQTPTPQPKAPPKGKAGGKTGKK